MTTLKCLRCENTITGNYLNNLVLAENTSGWVAWLNGSCTSVGLCPEHSPPMIAAVELLRSATGGEGPAKAVVISTFVKGPVPSNARSTISVRVSSTATCELCGEVWTSDNCADPATEAAKCAAQGEPPKPPWFDRIAEKGAFAFGGYGVRGDNAPGGVDSEAGAQGYWRIRKISGEHTWRWYFRNSWLSVNDSHSGHLPIEAVDPERGFDFCRYVKPTDAMRAYWRRVATSHYGIDSPVMPEALK